MNVKKIGRGIVRTAKANPALTLAVIGLIAPGLARKAAPIVVAAMAKDGGA